MSKYPQDFKEKRHEAARLKARQFLVRGNICLGGPPRPPPPVQLGLKGKFPSLINIPYSKENGNIPTSIFIVLLLKLSLSTFRMSLFVLNVIIFIYLWLIHKFYLFIINLFFIY